MTQIQSQLGLDTLVGPSAWEAAPTFESWVPGFEANQLTLDRAPLVVLEAIPEQHRTAAVTAAMQCRSWAVIGAWTPTWQDQEQARWLYDEILTGGGREQELLSKTDLKVYKKGWSQTGDKAQYQGGRMRLWTVPGVPKPRIVKGEHQPPMEPTLTGIQGDCATYVRATPSGPHLERDGVLAWTDGSVHTGGLTAGAGAWFRSGHRATPPSIIECVGGEPVIIRGEMGALTLALRAIPVTEPATLFTDSLSALWIIRRWLRRDFGYCLDEEGHPDLVKELIAALHARRGVRTDLVWVPSHAGDLGNEVADTLAKAGRDSGPPQFDRVCPDIEFWSPNRDLVNFLGWRAATTRWANTKAWQGTAAWLRETSTAASTQSLVRAGRGREHLGKTLANQDRSLTERAVRRMLQARGFNTPVQAVLSRNSGGKVSGICPFCHKEEETLGHFQFACKEFQEARTVAHNIVADATIGALYEEVVKGRKAEEGYRPSHRPLLWLNTAMQEIFPDLWGSKEGEFTPDGIVIDHRGMTVHVLELTRGMEVSERGWRDKIDEKIAAYHATVIDLQRRYPGYRILQSNFVVGALASVMEQEWGRSLREVGLDVAAAARVTRAAMRAAVEALDTTLGIRQTARVGLRGVEAGHSLHPSQRDRPPAPSGGPVA